MGKDILSPASKKTRGWRAWQGALLGLVLVFLLGGVWFFFNLPTLIRSAIREQIGKHPLVQESDFEVEHIGFSQAIFGSIRARGPAWGIEAERLTVNYRLPELLFERELGQVVLEQAVVVLNPEPFLRPLPPRAATRSAPTAPPSRVLSQESLQLPVSEFEVADSQLILANAVLQKPLAFRASLRKMADKRLASEVQIASQEGHWNLQVLPQKGGLQEIQLRSESFDLLAFLGELHFFLPEGFLPDLSPYEASPLSLEAVARLRGSRIEQMQVEAEIDQARLRPFPALHLALGQLQLRASLGENQSPQIALRAQALPECLFASTSGQTVVQAKPLQSVPFEGLVQLGPTGPMGKGGFAEGSFGLRWNDFEKTIDQMALQLAYQEGRLQLLSELEIGPSRLAWEAATHLSHHSEHGLRLQGAWKTRHGQLEELDLTGLLKPGTVWLGGQVEAEGKFAFRDEQAAANLRLQVREGTFHDPGLSLKAEGIETALEINDLRALTTQEPFPLTVASLDSQGVQVANLETRLQLRQQRKIAFEETRFEAFGGSLDLPAFVYAREGDSEMNLRFRRIDLAKLIRSFPQFKGQLSGRVDGRLPLRLKAGAIEPRGGRLYLTENTTAFLSFDARGLLTQTAEPGTAQYRALAQAEEALRQLRIGLLQGALLDPERPELLAQFRIEGEDSQNPGRSPLHLNLNLLPVEGADSLMELWKRREQFKLGF
ncbi:MAG: YdbH domain-containing protein [Verrucomicrobiota bacterium]